MTHTPLPRRVLIGLFAGVLAASCSPGSDPTTTILASTTTTTADTIAAQTTTSRNISEDVCPSNAGPSERIRWDGLAGEWATLADIPEPEATFDAGTSQDSGQFTFDDGTIVQSTVDQDTGDVVELFVISQVDPAAPMANLPAILDHWVELLTFTEPRLTPAERVGILQALGVVGDNLTLLDMNGTAECNERTYEVLFDIDLAAFVFGVDLSP